MSNMNMMGEVMNPHGIFTDHSGETEELNVKQPRSLSPVALVPGNNKFDLISSLILEEIQANPFDLITIICKVIFKMIFIKC